MKTIDIQDAQAPLADYVEHSAIEAVVVTRRGKPVAALIDVTGMDRETLSLSTNPRFIALLEESRAQRRRDGGVSLDDARRRLGLKAVRSSSSAARSTGKQASRIAKKRK